MNRHRYIDFHQCLISDRTRTEAYKDAIFQRVKEGDVVADIGAGTGILSIFAVRAGAAKVYAIERTELINAAREIIRQNGMEQRIHLLHGDSSEVELPEKVDVLLSELISEWGFEEHIAKVIEDARSRFLKEDGILIPEHLETSLVPVENHDFYREINFWSERHYEIDFTPLQNYALNRQYSTPLQSEHILAEPKPVISMDFYKDSLNSLEFELRFAVKRSGLLHGFSGWFRSDLTDTIKLGTKPPSKLPSWRNPFFPLAAPVLVKEGDQIAVKILGIPSKYSIQWDWSGEVIREGDGVVGRFHHGALVNAFRYQKIKTSHRRGAESAKEN